MPTDGLLRIVEIPRAESSAFGPIPDNNKIWGVPKDPAERIISFLAVTVVTAAREKKCQKLPVTLERYNHRPDLPPRPLANWTLSKMGRPVMTVFLVVTSFVTCALIRTSTYDRLSADARYDVEELLLEPFPMEF